MTSRPAALFHPDCIIREHGYRIEPAGREEALASRSPVAAESAAVSGDISRVTGDNRARPPRHGSGCHPCLISAFDMLGFEKNENTAWAGMEWCVCRSREEHTWVRLHDGFEPQAFVTGVRQPGGSRFAALDYMQGMQAGGVYYGHRTVKRSGNGPETLPLRWTERLSTPTESGVMFVRALLANPRGNIQASPDCDPGMDYP